MKDYKKFRDEWKRTEPDFVVYRPNVFAGSDYDNQHFIVTRTPGRNFLAFWTSAIQEGALDQHIVCARSTDNGRTWTKPQRLDGSDDRDDHIASWQFPIVSRTGRIYCFYHKFIGIHDYSRALTGVMRCQYSDNEGETWLPGGDLPIRRSELDHPDSRIPSNWIVWQMPILDQMGRWIVGFTRRASPSFLKDPRNRPENSRGWEECVTMMSQCELMRFDNINEGPEPRDLDITFLPEDATSLRVSYPPFPSISYAQEPAIALLPDGRLFMVMRTWTGNIYFSVSDDNGRSWRMPDVLRHKDEGEPMLQPKSGCPLYEMNDGRFIIFTHNNDGTANGGSGPGDYICNRWPLYLAIGEYQGNARQPIWFSRLKQFITTEGVAKPPAFKKAINAYTEVGDYTSFTEDEAGRILWYPDRKHFLLGKTITDEFLSDLEVSV